jgi:hypothetical protein
MRNTIREEVSRGYFDVYISHTDQTLFKYSHLVSYLHESKLLATQVSQDKPFALGFLR